MTTFTGPRAFSTIPPVDPGLASFVEFGIPGYIDIAANPIANDIFELCWVPAGFVCTGGMIIAGILDTNAGSETLDMDLGWAANGGSGTYDAVSTDGLGNFGVWKGDAFATGNINRVATNHMAFGGSAGAGLINGTFPFFTKKTKLQMLCNVTAATFGASRLSIIARGYVDHTIVVG